MSRVAKIQCIAYFTPQAWEDDYAIDVDPGRTPFDVSSQIDAMSVEQVMCLEDARESTDALAQGPGVPAWIRNWDGPYFVEVEDALEDYFERKARMESAAPSRTYGLDDGMQK